MKKLPDEPFSNSSTGLPNAEIKKLHQHLHEWVLRQNGTHYNQIQRSFAFETRKGALEFIENVRALGAEAGQNPTIQQDANRVSLVWSPEDTALTRNDFILAARTDQLYEGRTEKNAVDEASDESFPASDAPGWTTR